jgi:hypothetical protein
MRASHQPSPAPPRRAGTSRPLRPVSRSPPPEKSRRGGASTTHHDRSHQPDRGGSQLRPARPNAHLRMSGPRRSFLRLTPSHQRRGRRMPNGPETHGRGRRTRIAPRDPRPVGAMPATARPRIASRTDLDSEGGVSIFGHWHGEPDALPRSMACVAPVYRPRDAERTVLHHVIGEHLEAFLRAAAAAGDGEGLPQFVDARAGVRAAGVPGAVATRL